MQIHATFSLFTPHPALHSRNVVRLGGGGRDAADGERALCQGLRLPQRARGAPEACASPRRPRRPPRSSPRVAVKDKYGSDAEFSDGDDASTDSEDAESEDEDGEELTPAVDAAILRTLARIKRKDPEIYEAGKNVFQGASTIPRPALHILTRAAEERAGLQSAQPAKRRTKEPKARAPRAAAIARSHPLARQRP
jgi:hypothetical protein